MQTRIRAIYVLLIGLKFAREFTAQHGFVFYHAYGICFMRFPNRQVCQQTCYVDAHEMTEKVPRSNSPKNHGTHPYKKTCIEDIHVFLNVVGFSWNFKKKIFSLKNAYFKENIKTAIRNWEVISASIQK